MSPMARSTWQAQQPSREFSGTNTIQSNGNVNWVIPGSGLRDVMELMGLLAAQGQSPTSNPLLFDYVARATSSFRWLNP